MTCFTTSARRCGARTLTSTLALAAGLAASGAAAAEEFVAPYVQSPHEDVERLLELAGVGPGDYLVDLGSGDGRIVITAALRGATAHGVELERELVELSWRNAREAEVGDRAAFVQGDIFDADLSRASVVTLYLMPEVNLRLRSKLLSELVPGTRVASISFDMGEWQPDRRAEGRVSGGLMVWVVPAPVAGRWVLQLDGHRLDLAIDQQFQSIDATLRRGAQRLHVLESHLRGDRFALLAGDGGNRYALSGRVLEHAMEGWAQIHALTGTRVVPWEARRVAAPDS